MQHSARCIPLLRKLIVLFASAPRGKENIPNREKLWRKEKREIRLQCGVPGKVIVDSAVADRLGKAGGDDRHSAHFQCSLPLEMRAGGGVAGAAG